MRCRTSGLYLLNPTSQGSPDGPRLGHGGTKVGLDVTEMGLVDPGWHGVTQEGLRGTQKDGMGPVGPDVTVEDPMSPDGTVHQQGALLAVMIT